jgi:hypothetical protein
MRYSTQVKPNSHLKAEALETETLALLKILALGMQQVEEGKTVPAGDAFAEILKTTIAGRSRASEHFRDHLQCPPSTPQSKKKAGS